MKAPESWRLPGALEIHNGGVEAYTMAILALSRDLEACVGDVKIL